MAINRGFQARRVHIAGSISPRTLNDLADYAHVMVKIVVQEILEAGGGIVVGAGKEPLLEHGHPVLFDWTVLETVDQCIQAGACVNHLGGSCPIIVVLSEKGEKEIPDHRKTLWHRLVQSGKVDVISIRPGVRSASMIRDKQVSYGDILLILGGGSGVEHLAENYQKTGKPVIPLDLPLGASREDGTGGSVRLNREARAEPLKFIKLQKHRAGSEGALLTAISTENGSREVSNVARGIMEIIFNLALPTVFYVRLLNSQHEAHSRVERFFRNVVDPLIEELGMTRIDLGIDRLESGFINLEIFQRLSLARVAVVDITGERPNCFIELGYALGRQIQVICTAEEGTRLPFDQQAIPCFFWNDKDDDIKRKQDLFKFWEQYIGRGFI